MCGWLLSYEEGKVGYSRVNRRTFIWETGISFIRLSLIINFFWCVDNDTL